MSNLAYRCCCGGSGSPCPASDSCVCATSYSVSGISLAYTFQRSSSAPNCVACGQGGCSRVDYLISVSATQLGSLVVARQGLTALGEQCCWRGNGQVRVTYSVEFQYFRTCLSALNYTWPKQTYTGTIDVPCCLHVTCAGQANQVACARNFGFARGYRHKLEICDFPIACNDVTIGGSRNALDECTGDLSCDALGASCDYGPFSLWCIGGHVSFLSRYQCLQTLTTGDYGCLGYHRQGTRCTPACTGLSGYESRLDEAVGQRGPFAMALREECDAGGAYPCSGDPRTWLGGFPTLVGSTGSEPFASLVSDCAYTDYSSTDSCSTVQVSQSPCPNFWTYT